MTHYIVSNWQEEKLTEALSSESLTLKKQDSSSRQRVYFDSFSHDLENGLFRLYKEGDELFLSIYGEAQDQISGFNPNRKFYADFPDSMLRDVLKVKMPLRCLLEQGDFQIVTDSYVIINEDEKTVARLTIEKMNQETMPLKVTIESLRGYEWEFGILEKFIIGFSDCQDDIDWLNLHRDFNEIPYYQSKPNYDLHADETVRTAMSRMILKLLEVIRQNEEGTIQDLDIEFLHDYRVGFRRIRSLIALMKGAYPAEQTLKWKTTMRALASGTNKLRDLDVYLLDEDEYKSMLPESLRKGLDTMFNDFKNQRSEVQKSVAGRFSRRPYKATMEELINDFKNSDKLPESENSEISLQEAAENIIFKKYKKVCKFGVIIDENTPDEQVHDLRLECKKLRYMLEFFATLFPEQEIRKIIKSLKRLQDCLGRFNDFSVQQLSMLEYLNEKTKATRELSLALGGLIVVMHQKQIEARNQVTSRFVEFNNQQMSMLFENLFHHRSK